MWNLLDTWDNQSEQLNVDNLHIVKHVGIYWNIVGLALIIYDNISEWFTDTIYYCMYYNIFLKTNYRSNNIYSHRTHTGTKCSKWSNKNNLLISVSWFCCYPSSFGFWSWSYMLATCMICATISRVVITVLMSVFFHRIIIIELSYHQYVFPTLVFTKPL